MPFLIPDWDDKLQALPTKIQSRHYWQYGFRTHASEPKKILGSVVFNMIIDDDVLITIRNLAIDC